jgi:predicted nucleotidyltransferase
MSTISFDLSGKIDPVTIDVLLAVKEAADSLRIAFFVVGATARDVILQHCYNVTPHRMTMDIDIGVEVEDWEQFHELSNILLRTGKFSETKEKQRLLYKNRRPVDIIPFGKITDKNRKISWPPEQEIFMSMLGFKEAYEYSITVRLNKDPILDIKLPTLPGLALMKFISWNEKYPLRKKDAEDILFIMNNYDRAGNIDRLYEMEPSLLEDSGFETREAGVRLLGRDMANIADPDTLGKVKEILLKETGEQERYRLIEDIIRGSLDYADKFDEVLNNVEKLKLGILEIEK